MTYPEIDDAMVERAYSATLGWDISKSAVRSALQAALNRRTGVKDRRVERDDTPACPVRRGDDCGRRATDGTSWYTLPLKSTRLAREAAEKAAAEPEIDVSEGMKWAGASAYAEAAYGGGVSPPHWLSEFVARIYRAMRKREMAERGHTAASGWHFHRRETDPVGSHSAPHKPHRRKGDV